MASPSSRRTPLVPQLIEQLQRQIHDGRWPVGARLPLEAELIEEFGVSRVTLRQAVQALVHVGLLETIQGNGTFVRATSEIDAVMARLLNGENLGFILEARLGIEVQAAILATEHITAEEVRALHEILDRSVTAAHSEDIQQLAHLSTLFHTGLVAASRNPVLRHLHHSIVHGTEESIRSGSEYQPLPAFVEEHRRILDAISTGDAKGAAEATRAHLGGALDAQKSA